jgi:hypothetical protein
MSSTKPGELLVMFQDVETIDEARRHLEALGFEFRGDVAFDMVKTVLAGVPAGREEAIAEALSKIVSGTLNTSPFFEDGGPGPTKDEAP